MSATQTVDLQSVINRFNARQQEAVRMSLDSCLVLAGAGSGKTAVLTTRIAAMIQQMNVLPDRIMAVTFTNKAAEEMKRRLRKLVGDETVAKMWIGTFHSLCNRILRQEHEAAGLPKGFAILDDDGQTRIVRQILRDRKEDAGQAVDEDDPEDGKPREYVKEINAAKEAQKGPFDIDEDLEGLPNGFVDVYVEYQKICREQGLLDFNDLQSRTLELFRLNPALQKAFSHRFQCVLVDEFQDTNETQYTWLQQVTNHSTCVMAVGDDDQSIYGFRGAQPQNMQRFLEEFAKGRQIALEQNYRSLPFVLEAANAVIANNKGRLGKTLFSDRQDKREKIDFVSCENEYEESRFVANQVKSLIAKGVRPADISILYRTNTQSRLFEQEMLKASIPVTVYGGFRFYNREEIRHLFAYLDLACNLGRDISLSRIINVPARGLGERTVENLRLQAKEAGISMIEKIAQNAELTDAPDKKQLALENFATCIVGMAEASQTLSLADFVDHVLIESGLEQLYLDLAQKKKGTKKKASGEEENEGEKALENLYAARDNAAQFEADFIAARQKAGEKPPAGGWKAVNVLPDYLAEIALLTSSSEADISKKNTVSLMTVHASKGLEFEHVFLVGMEDGIFPHKRSLPDPNAEPGCQDSLYLQQLAQLEEERRLMYVAITRAKKALTMTRASKRKLPSGWESSIPSRFIEEIPPERLKLVGFSTRKEGYSHGFQRKQF